MIEYNVHRISSQYDFVINGVSYIGNPKPHTAMFVTLKAKELLGNLDNVSNCLIFAERGLDVEDYIRNNNCFFLITPNGNMPDLPMKYMENGKLRNLNGSFSICRGGYYLGENVQIGNNAYIEPGCLIGHDLIIGDNACILSGAVVTKSVDTNMVVAGNPAKLFIKKK